jgi:predicted transcriptional regulator
MANIVVRAYYRERPLIGYIRISQITGMRPRRYSMSLHHEDKGVLEKSQHPTPDAAIARASLLGFTFHKWEKEEKTVL